MTDLASCNSLNALDMDLSNLNFEYDPDPGYRRDALLSVSQCRNLRNLKLHNCEGVVGDCYQLFVSHASLVRLSITHCSPQHFEFDPQTSTERLTQVTEAMRAINGE